MTDLTEQWRKGKLDRNKIYYYKTPFNTVDTASGYWLCNHLDTEKDKVEILNEVPSYEEWFNQGDYIAFLEEENTKLKTENKWYSEQLNEAVKEVGHLKELIKECKDLLSYLQIDDYDGNGLLILNKINQVLGEENGN